MHSYLMKTMNVLLANQNNRLHIEKYFKLSTIGISHNDGKFSMSF